MEIITPHDVGYFCSTSQILWLVYWSIFGMVEMQQEDFIFYMFEQKITKIVSNIMFAVYNWIIVIILINMLIAMMARSYEIIAVSYIYSE